MALWPRGCVSVQDLPNDLFVAIQHASVVLSWLKNLPKEEQPPQWMWHLNAETTAWFDEIEMIREAKYGGQGGSDDEVVMERNDFARDFN